MEYQILEAPTAQLLSFKVNSALQDGWNLHGLLSVVISSDNKIKKTYSQAMTRD